MEGAQGIALEWALALLRAPGERHALRQRPLPDGIEMLLAIAAGTNPKERAAAAARLHERPEVVREAARFFVREVLFHPQADAYRVLGVQADASAAAIKAHHRLLQQWLHPDRLQSEDDSIFAARVNTAWSCLRTDARRQAYDNTRPIQAMTATTDPQAGLRPLPAWTPFQEAPPPGVRHRLPVYVLLFACLVLGALVARDAVREPQVDLSGRLAQAGDAADSVAAIHIPQPGAEPAPAPPMRSLQAATVMRRQPASLVADAASHRQAHARSDSPATTPAAMVSASPPPMSLAPRPTASPAAPAPVQTPAPRRQGRSQPMAAVAAVVTMDPGSDSSVAALPASAAADAKPAVPGFARIQLARQAGSQLLQYMGAADRQPPPIWNSPGILSSAEMLRAELHQHGRLQLGAPEWRIGADSALLSAPMARQGLAARGRLSADLVWREGQWMVTGIGVEQMP